MGVDVDTRPGAKGAGAPLAPGFLDAAIQHVAHPIFVKDRPSLSKFVNEAFVSLVGRPREAMLGKTDAHFVSADEADFFLAEGRGNPIVGCHMSIRA